MRQATSLGLCLILGVAATAMAQQGPSFRTSVGDTIFGGAESMTTADLDGDGIPDMIYPSGQSGVVVVFYGLGDGLFDFQREFATGNVPVAAAVADYDGDGFQDIATVDSTSSTISVILGTGDRDFFSDPIFSIPRSCSGTNEACEFVFDCPLGQTCDEHGVSSPNAIVAADLNGDGQPDLAIVSGEAQGEVAVAFNAGEGRFSGASPSPYTTQAASRAIAVADVNGDGRPDLLTANRDASSISVLLNAGSGIFHTAESYPAGEAPVSLALADFDGDGNLDVVVANRNTDQFSVLAGDGEGAFGAPTAFLAGLFPSGIASGDFDGDGNADVAVSNKLSYDVTVGFGDGQGGFVRRSYLGPTGPEMVAAVPVSGAGPADLIVLGKSGEGDRYSVLLTQPPRSFVGVETVRTGSNPNSVCAGDIGGDGVPDLVVSSASSTNLTVIRTVDSIPVPVSLDLGGATYAVLLADLDFTGRPDLLVSVSGEVGGDRLAVAPADGRGGFGEISLYNVADAAASIEVGDFNEDGLLDVAMTQGDVESVAILIRTAEGGFLPPQEIVLRPLGDPDPYFPRGVATADLDGDGHLDLAIAEFRDLGVLSVVYGRGDGTFELPPVSLPSGRRPLAVAIVDLDEDGILDILTANEDTAGLVIHRGVGGRSYATPVTLGAGRVPAGLTLRDFTGDNILDVTVADRTDDRNIIRPGGGNPPSYLRGIVQVCPEIGCLDSGRTPLAVAGADLDSDGSYDLVTVNDGGSNVSIAYSTLQSEVLRGDANADGLVTVADITRIWSRMPQYNRQRVEALVRADPEQWNLAFDADGDGLVSSVDTTAVVARIFD